MTQTPRHYINREPVSGEAYELARKRAFTTPAYDAAAVDDAIASSNRAGQPIFAEEARVIHTLLRGRNAP